MSLWGRWCQGSPRCWLFWSFCVFNRAPWSPFQASPVLMEWALGAHRAVSCSLYLPAPAAPGCCRMCSVLEKQIQVPSGSVTAPHPSDTPQTPGAGLEKSGENCQVLTACKEPWWLWELYPCNELIESLWDLQFKFWVFPLSICFKGICVRSYFFSLCTSALEAGTLWSDRNKLVWSEIE